MSGLKLWACLELVDKSVSHLRSKVALFQLDNRQIYKQLRQNKDCIQDYQTYHQHLEAKEWEDQ